MSEAAYVPAVGPRGHVVNGQIHPITGFIENPGFVDSFDSARKVMFLEVYKRNGLRLRRACNDIGVSKSTVNHHYQTDTAFKDAFDEVVDQYKEDLECDQMEFARDKKCFMDRAMQLRRLMPEKYDPAKSAKQEITLMLNLTGAVRSVGNAKVIDVETDRVLVNGLANPLANDDISDGRP